MTGWGWDIIAMFHEKKWIEVIDIRDGTCGVFIHAMVESKELLKRGLIKCMVSMNPRSKLFIL